jgi:hypothetical protein
METKKEQLVYKSKRKNRKKKNRHTNVGVESVKTGEWKWEVIVGQKKRRRKKQKK